MNYLVYYDDGWDSVLLGCYTDKDRAKQYCESDCSPKPLRWVESDDGAEYGVLDQRGRHQEHYLIQPITLNQPLYPTNDLSDVVIPKDDIPF